MKTNLKLSAKMHLFIIISSVIIAVGLAVGLICQFATSQCFFNFGADWSSYQTLVVNYNYGDLSGADKDPRDTVEELCKTALDEAKLGGYSKQYGKTGSGEGGSIIYTFSTSADTDKIAQVAEDIQQKISAAVQGGNVILSNASAHVDTAYPHGGKALWRGGVALATVCVFGFLYFLVRYKVSMALAALLADAHNVLLLLAILAITRVPVGSSVFAIVILTAVLTMVGCAFFFGGMRKNIKNEDYKKLSAEELVDLSSNQTLMMNVLMPASLAVVAILFFVLMSVSSLSPLSIMAPIVGALIAVVVCAYGTAFFIPSVYSRFKKIGENFKPNTSRSSSKKSAESSK